MENVREFEVDEETKNYTIMDNRRYLDLNISNAALGLLDRITSLPDNWDYSFNGLVAICKDGKSAIRSQINELKEHGYIEIDKLRTEKGTFRYHYRVHNNPQSLKNKGIEPAPDFPTLDKPTMDNPTSVNQPQYNTKKYNTKEIDKKDRIDKTQAMKNPFVIDLIKSGYITSDEYNITFYDSLFNDYVNRGYEKVDIYSVIHYIIRGVKRNNFKDENGNEISNKFGYLKSAMAISFKRFEDAGKPLWPELEEDDWLNDNEPITRRKNNDFEL